MIKKTYKYIGIAVGVCIIVGTYIFVKGYFQHNISRLEKGEEVLFGSYEQDGNIYNGNEPITWIVIDVKESEAILMSKKILDCLPFTYCKGTDVYWEKSFARDWLNNEFYESAFNDEEKICIQASRLANDPNPIDCNTYFKKEQDTEDKVYLLSFDELVKYGFCLDFGLSNIQTYEDRYDYICKSEDLEYKQEKDERKCVVTSYVQEKLAVSKANYTSDTEIKVYYTWALRSKGMGEELNGAIMSEGTVNLLGIDSTVEQGIRPIIKINYKNSKFNMISQELKGKEHVPENMTLALAKRIVYLTENLNYNDINEKSIVMFGRYEMDGNKENGLEPIEWSVIDKNKSEITLFSRYVLDYQCFSDLDKDINWENSNLRKWLNGDFYNSAFSEDEKKIIKKTRVISDAYPLCSVDNYTVYDYVFVPSLEEMCDEKRGYLNDPYTNDINRRCTATKKYQEKMSDYEKKNTLEVAYTRENKKAFSYCLRTRTKTFDYNQVFIVSVDGDCSIEPVDLLHGIRPVIKIQIIND